MSETAVKREAGLKAEFLRLASGRVVTGAIMRGSEAIAVVNCDDVEEITNQFAASGDLLAACDLAEKCLIDLAPHPPEVSEAVVAIVEIVHAARAKARGGAQ